MSRFPVLKTFVSTERAAEILGVVPATLRRWRLTGDGPPFLRVGPKICRYAIEDLQAFISARMGLPSEVE